jgi:MFS family permease
MMIARFAIGLVEAGFYPAVLYHMEFWYKPSEMPWRIALLYSVGQISSALSGLLAFAIGFMSGLGQLAGRRWLFLLEGGTSCHYSGIRCFVAPDYPQTARFLNSQEHAFILTCLSSAAPSSKKGEWDFGSLKFSSRIRLCTPLVCTGLSWDWGLWRSLCFANRHLPAWFHHITDHKQSVVMLKVLFSVYCGV